ncbi:MAG: alpha/beta hydrolase [Polyangiales bacterium]
MTTDFTSKGLVYTLETATDVVVERDHSYATASGPLGFDLYRPRASGARPAVVFVSGFPDPGMTAMVGKPLKDWASYQGWGRLVAASGLVGIAYLNREPADVVALVHHLRENAASLGIDPDRIAVWACSGNVPTALSLVAREKLACAALLYGFTLDVADEAARFHFAAPTAGFDDLPRDLPMLVVRATKDATPGLDANLQRFIAEARKRALPITVIEHDGPHAFDVVDDTDASRAAIEQVLAFLQRHA